jgi:hypothetical protein
MALFAAGEQRQEDPRQGTGHCDVVQLCALGHVVADVKAAPTQGAWRSVCWTHDTRGDCGP